jgi:hypothetical protein
MNETVWIEKKHFHCIGFERGVFCVELEVTPFADSTWLINSFSTTLKVSRLWFKSTHDTRSTYSDFRLNAAELDELLAKADLP